MKLIENFTGNELDDTAVTRRILIALDDTTIGGSRSSASPQPSTRRGHIGSGLGDQWS
jgi:hypothetical protein